MSHLGSLPGRIDQILWFEMGRDISGRGLNHGFDHVAVFGFADEPTRDAYRDHPEHTAFVDAAMPAIETLLVFDYWGP